MENRCSRTRGKDSKIKMIDIYQVYKSKCDIQSDINEHLPTLYKYARECEHITEMGVRWIVSTWAFLAARPKKMISYDIKNPIHWGSRIEDVLFMARNEDLNYVFIEADVLKVEIEETDLLFLDTIHNYAQVKEELRLHSGKVRKYIIFHDTVTYGNVDESNSSPNSKGIGPAIFEFLQRHPDWYLREQFLNNNGLIVLARIT